MRTSLAIMKTTVEVRWFFENEPKNITSWFAQFEKWPSEHRQPLKFTHQWERSDYYLNFGKYSKMSFKIREGKSEIKLLEKKYGPKIFSNYAIGNVEKWIKWTVDFKDANASPSTVFSNSQEFQEVKKERMLLMYEVSDDNSLARIDPSRESNNSFQLELSRLNFNRKEYFSFALEMDVDATLRIKNFYAISESFFSKIDCQNFNAQNSFSYSYFLQLKK
jgi:hypothetical protein